MGKPARRKLDHVLVYGSPDRGKEGSAPGSIVFGAQVASDDYNRALFRHGTARRYSLLGPGPKETPEPKLGDGAQEKNPDERYTFYPVGATLPELPPEPTVAQDVGADAVRLWALREAFG